MKIVLISTVFLICSNLFGQSNGIMNESRFIQVVNPSFAALNHLNKVGVLYNVATINSNDKLDNKYAFGAMAFNDDHFSLGFDISSYKIQNTDLTSTLSQLSFVYVLQLNSSTFLLPGITLGYRNSTINLEGLIFEDQINKTTGYVSPETIDPLGERLGKISYPDLGASLIIHNEKYFVGLTLSHLNQPNTSFDKASIDKLPFSFSVQGGFDIDINRYQRNYLPVNSFLFLYHSINFIQKTKLLNLSQEVQLSNFSFGLNQKASMIDKFNLNSIGLSLGLAIENFDFGFQYNFPIRKFSEVYSPNVFELYFTFDFSAYRRNNKGLFKRLQTDNY